MWATGIKIGPLRFKHETGVSERAEQGLVEHFIAQTADQRLDEGTLLRLARSDVMPADLVILAPSQDRFGELCAIVTHNGLRFATDG
jgi:hypothetical protein